MNYLSPNQRRNNSLPALKLLHNTWSCRVIPPPNPFLRLRTFYIYFNHILIDIPLFRDMNLFSPFITKDPLFRENVRNSLIPDIFFFPSLCPSSGSLGNRLNISALFSTLPSVIFLQQHVPSAIILMASSLRKSGIMLCPFAFCIDTSVPMGFRSSLFRYRQWIVWNSIVPTYDGIPDFFSAVHAEPVSGVSLQTSFIRLLCPPEAATTIFPDAKLYRGEPVFGSPGRSSWPLTNGTIQENLPTFLDSLLSQKCCVLFLPALVLPCTHETCLHRKN